MIFSTSRAKEEEKQKQLIDCGIFCSSSAWFYHALDVSKKKKKDTDGPSKDLSREGERKGEAQLYVDFSNISSARQKRERAIFDEATLQAIVEKCMRDPMHDAKQSLQYKRRGIGLHRFQVRFELSRRQRRVGSGVRLRRKRRGREEGAGRNF